MTYAPLLGQGLQLGEESQESAGIHTDTGEYQQAAVRLAMYPEAQIVSSVPEQCNPVACGALAG